MLNIIKNKKLWIGILVVCAPLCFILYLLSLMQIIPSYSHGFGVDSSERVYLGLDGHILVYEENVETDNFSSQTSRGYYMTVKEDVILIGTGNRSISMDLAGNVLSDEEDDLSRAVTEVKKM